MSCERQLREHGLRQAVEEVWMFVICLHPASPQNPTVRLCVGSRDASPELWTFSTPESTAAPICFTELFFPFFFFFFFLFGRRETDAP